MSIYYANEIDEYLAHYGVKGMKWGKHLKFKGGGGSFDGTVKTKKKHINPLRLLTEIKKRKQLSDPEWIKRAKQKNKTALYGIVKGGKAGYEKRKRRRKRTYQIKKSLTTSRNKARRYIKSIMNNAFRG